MKRRESISSDSMEEIDYAREEARNAARAVRNCSNPLCDEGFISRDEERDGRLYRFAYEHSCYKAWRTAMRDMLIKAGRYEQETGREYPNLVTKDMTYLGRPTHEQISKAEFNELYRDELSRLVGRIGEIREENL